MTDSPDLLAAAAEDLYSALEACKHLVCLSWCDDDGSHCEECRRAKDALAKADGVSA